MDPSKEADAKMDGDTANDIDTINSDGVKAKQMDKGKSEECGSKTQSIIDDQAEHDYNKVDTTENCNEADVGEQNVSSSWVFVDVKSTSGKSDNKRKFYLNCSEEPVQELHQHEMSVHASASDSDYSDDGISVISESDPSKTDEEGALQPGVFREIVEDVKYESEAAVRQEETNGTTEVSQVIRTSRTQRSLTLSQLSYLTAFSILIIVVPLQWYFQLYDFERKEVEPNGKIPNIPSKIEIDRRKTEPIHSDRLVLDDPFAYCAKIHENTDYMYKSKYVKKCIKKLERAQEKLNRVHQKLQNAIPESDDVDGNEDIEEIHLNYKAEYSKLNNDENKHEVYTKKVKYRKPHESKGRNKYEKEYRIIRNTTNKEAKAYKFEYYSDKDKGTGSSNKPELGSKQKPKTKEDEVSNKYLDYENKLKAKEKYLSEKEQYLHLKQKQLRERKIKTHQATENTVRLEGKNDKEQNRSSNYYNDSKMKKKFNRNDPGDKLNDSDQQHTDKRHAKKKTTKSSADYLPNDESSSEYRAKNMHHKVNNKNAKDHTKQKRKQRGASSNENNEGWYNNLFAERSRLRKRNRDDDYHNENNKIKRNTDGKRYRSEEDDSQNGHWYAKLFAGRAKLRKNPDKYFTKDDDLLSEYKMYSNRYRTDSFSL